MLTRNEILAAFQNEGISVYETSFCYDQDVDITLKSNNIFEIVHIAKENNLKTAFFAYEVPDEDKYIIADEDKLANEEYEGEAAVAYQKYEKYFERRKKSFNLEVKSYDFEKPTAVHVYVLIAGVQVGIVQFDPWTEEIEDKYGILEEVEIYFEELLDELMENAREKQEMEQKRILNIVFQYLDTTDEWHQYTNQQMRRSYCIRLAEEYSQKYSVDLSYLKIYEELENKWRKYKSRKK